MAEKLLARQRKMIHFDSYYECRVCKTFVHDEDAAFCECSIDIVACTRECALRVPNWKPSETRWLVCDRCGKSVTEPSFDE